MSRLALVLTVAVLTLRAPAARGEPLDLDLSRLGAPDQNVWDVIEVRSGVTLGGTPEQLAAEAKQRFAILSSELALALSGPILAPASTTGHAGFDVALEGAYAPVHGDPVGVAPGAGFSNQPWTAGVTAPSSVTTTGLHVRKAFPFSFEIGGRLTYLNQSSYYAAQGEAKWALNEGFQYVPDFAVRIAYTRLFNQPDWNLGATDVDLMISKRWGVNAVTSFTPYLAARFTYVNASSEPMNFWTPDPAPTTTTPPPPSAAPAEMTAAVARFPNLNVGYYRTTLGVRMTAGVVSLALEGTYFGGKKYSGGDAATLAAGEYGDFEVQSSFAAAAKLGWEF
jgi:hypothetical protein